MTKAIDWISTVVFMFVFAIILLLFHPLQMIGLRIGYSWHKKVVDVMIWFLLKALWIIGKPVTFKGIPAKLPQDSPLIIVSNHASMFDIPVIGWALKKYHPKYVSKIELAHGIPSISYNIRKGGSAIIDRRDPDQAHLELEKMGRYIEQTNRAAVIFPEGTRSKNGQLKKFKLGGVLTLMEYAPSALIVPVVITNTYHIEKYRMKPISFGNPITCEILPLIDKSKYEPQELVEEIKKRIQDKLGQKA